MLVAHVTVWIPITGNVNPVALAVFDGDLQEVQPFSIETGRDAVAQCCVDHIYGELQAVRIALDDVDLVTEMDAVPQDLQSQLAHLCQALELNLEYSLSIIAFVTRLPSGRELVIL